MTKSKVKMAYMFIGFKIQVDEHRGLEIEKISKGTKLITNCLNMSVKCFLSHTCGVYYSCD